MQLRLFLAVSIVLSSRSFALSLLTPVTGGASAAALAAGGSTSGWLLAQAETVDVVKTTDGRVHTGRILTETERGYLFQPQDGAAFVIELAQILDLTRTVTQRPQPAAPAPSPAVSPGSARLLAVEKELKDLRGLSENYSANLVLILTCGPGLGLGIWMLAADIVPGLAIATVIVCGILFLIGVIGIFVKAGAAGARQQRIEELEVERARLSEVRGASDVRWALPDVRHPLLTLAAF